MSRRLAPSWPLLMALSVIAVVPGAAQQQGQGTSRGPRFLLAAWSPGRELDVTAVPVLRRRVSLELSQVTIDEALKEVTRQADLEIAYSPRIVPLGRVVSLHAGAITVAAALTEILLDVEVDVSVTAGGGLALVRRSPVAVRETADTGVISGQVSDSGSGAPVVGALVSVEGARRTAVTDAEGRYRIGGIAEGTYVVRARYIGYRPAVLSVTVAAGGEATANLVLTKTAHQLEQVVVTGTIVPTEVKALPTPVTVIDEEDIALQRPQTVQEVFRRAVPGAVSWVYNESPYDTQLSVRGASSLNTSAPSMKTFVDGVEVATASYAQVDPPSIARIEVIRGPQAAAIYGSEAIGGVVQIFTKRGDPGLTRPQVNAEAGVGVVQTPYAGKGSVLRQEYKASVRGGGADIGYNLGAGYSHLGDWLPAGEISRQSSPSVYGAMNFARGIISVDLSGRHYTQNGAINANPDLLETGFPPFSKPNYGPLKFQNQTLGARFSVTPRHWWSATVKVGLDRYSTDVAQTRPRLTTPVDTLFLVTNSTQTKTSVGVTSAVQRELGSGVTGSLTAGFEHWNNSYSDWVAFGALNTTGALETPEGFTAATRNMTHNTGYFAQTQIGFHDVVFLTAGLRAEQNSEFGDSLGTPLSPRVGISYVRDVGSALLKFRGSWGRAIRAPSPGQKQGFVRTTVTQLPNPVLGPERQHGWDAGIDATLGARASVGLTYYDQTADNLADVVLLQLEPIPTQQFQNVGRVRNRGVELEASLALGRLTVHGQYGYSRARVDRLSPTYLGELRVGDQVLMRPKHTAGASLTVLPFIRTTLSAGVTYVGSWTNSDALALYRCLGGTGPCLPTSRDYLVSYPALLKLNLSVFQQLTSSVSGFVAVDNLTNNKRHEGTNFAAVLGRRTTTGLRLQY